MKREVIETVFGLLPSFTDLAGLDAEELIANEVSERLALTNGEFCTGAASRAFPAVQRLARLNKTIYYRAPRFGQPPGYESPMSSFGPYRGWGCKYTLFGGPNRHSFSAPAIGRGCIHS